MIFAQFQPRLGTEQGDPVDLAAWGRDMFLIAPAQAAEEIKLPLARVIIIGRVRPGQRVIAGFVQMGILDADRIRIEVKITGIEVDDIAQHRVAPLFCMKGQHLGHCAAFAERVEQVFCVVAVEKPCPRRGFDQAVDGRCEYVGRQCVCIYPVQQWGQIVRQIKGCGHKDKHSGKARVQMMTQGRCNLDLVLDEDQGDGTIGQNLAAARQKILETGIPHRPDIALNMN